MKKLHSLKTAEVSLVPKGANGKRFAVLKEDNVGDETLFSKVRKAIGSFAKKPKEEEGEDAGQTDDQQLSREAQTALEATARILAPHKDEITDEHLDQVQEHLGIGGGEHESSEEGEEGDDDMAKGKVKDDHMQEAMGKAKKAYKEHLEKLGYAKYPEGELMMKAKEKAEEEDDNEGDSVSKEQIKVRKEDGSLNLEAVPQEMRPFMEEIAKEMVSSKSRADAAEAKSAKLEKELTDNKASARKAEIASIAKGFTNLSADHVAKVLEKFDGDKEGFESVLKGFEVQNAQIGDSKLFGTIGTSTSENAGGVNSDLMTKVEKAVAEVVQKAQASGQSITKEQAMVDYMMNHPELYAQEKARREASGPSRA